jgi:hypothetical protein
MTDQSQLFQKISDFDRCMCGLYHKSRQSRCYTVHMKQQRPANDGHTKKHGLLSANSIFLRQDDAYSHKISPRNVVILLAAVLISLGILSALWITTRKHNTPKLSAATVEEQGFGFKLNYYHGATTQKSRSMNYLVSRDEHGVETTIWVTRLEKVLNCGGNPNFSYPSDTGLQAHSSCYKPDRTVFVSDVVVDDQVYQINMTSEQAIDVADARDIFRTIDIMGN